MMEILHHLKDPKQWELWYIPYYGYCRISIISRTKPHRTTEGSLLIPSKGLD